MSTGYDCSSNVILQITNPPGLLVLNMLHHLLYRARRPGIADPTTLNALFITAILNEFLGSASAVILGWAVFNPNFKTLLFFHIFWNDGGACICNVSAL